MHHGAAVPVLSDPPFGDHIDRPGQRRPGDGAQRFSISIQGCFSRRPITRTRLPIY
jgi:hypothetical protein